MKSSPSGQCFYLYIYELDFLKIKSHIWKSVVFFVLGVIFLICVCFYANAILFILSQFCSEFWIRNSWVQLVCKIFLLFSWPWDFIRILGCTFSLPKWQTFIMTDISDRYHDNYDRYFIVPAVLLMAVLTS